MTGPGAEHSPREDGDPTNGIVGASSTPRILPPQAVTRLDDLGLPARSTSKSDTADGTAVHAAPEISKRSILRTIRDAWTHARRIAPLASLASTFGGAFLHVSVLLTTVCVTQAYSSSGSASDIWKGGIVAALACIGTAMIAIERSRQTFRRSLDGEVETISRQHTATLTERDRQDEIVRSKARLSHFYSALFAAGGAGVGWVTAVTALAFQQWQFTLFAVYAMGFAIGRRVASAEQVAEMYRQERLSGKKVETARSLAGITRKLPALFDELSQRADEAEEQARTEQGANQARFERKSLAYTVPLLLAAPIGALLFLDTARSGFALKEATGFVSCLLALAVSSFSFMNYAGIVAQEQRTIARILGFMRQFKNAMEDSERTRESSEATLRAAATPSPVLSELRCLRFDGVKVFTTGSATPILDLDGVQFLRGFNFVQAPRGSGKTVLKSLIARELRPSSGVITVVTNHGEIALDSVAGDLWEGNEGFRTVPLQKSSDRKYSREEVELVLRIAEDTGVRLPDEAGFVFGEFRDRRPAGQAPAGTTIEPQLSDSQGQHFEDLIAVSGEVQFVVAAVPRDGMWFFAVEHLKKLAQEGVTVIFFSEFLPYDRDAIYGRIIELRSGRVRRVVDGPITAETLPSIFGPLSAAELDADIGPVDGEPEDW